VIIVAAAVAAGYSGPPLVCEREPYEVPLARLSVSFADDGGAQYVRINLVGSDDYVTIGPEEDAHIRPTRRGKETTSYPESRSNADQLSAFEAAQLRTVVGLLIETLRGFESDLARDRWGRVHYLDGFLLRFLRGFHHLYDVATCCSEGLPRTARIPESAFDVSTTSPKTDERVAGWRSTKDHVVKLRISAKALVGQLAHWMGESESDYRRLFDKDVQKAYTLFVRTYLGRAAVPDGRVATQSTK